MVACAVPIWPSELLPMSDAFTVLQGDDDQRQARDQSLRGKQPPAATPGYQAERFLGAGAYGEVWLAVDGNSQRKVAIKFYAHRGGLDWSLLSREVEKLTFLFADRRFVQLLGVGWDADPPYYVMEFLENGSLDDRIRQAPLSAADALPLFSEIAQGLVHAHAKGVLHCDLKPANVLLGADGQPRLADFGQSRLSHEQSPALGTLFYMAPEQADLRAVPTVGWDVYALGALMHCMLTGEPPHRNADLAGKIESAPSLDERMAVYRRAIRQAKPTTRHRQAPGVDAALADIVDRCLEPAPERRFTTVQAVLDALEQRRQRQARRPLLLLGAVGPALLLTVVSLFAWASYQRAMDVSRKSVLARAAESNSFAAEFVAETVARQMERRYQALDFVALDREFRQLTALATGKGTLDDPDRKRLQQRLETLEKEVHLDDETIWFISDIKGMHLARIPEDERSVGGLYAFRDYFHGQGRDLDPTQPTIPPLQGPYQSIVFEGKTSLRRQVAFSLPVYAAEEDGPAASAQQQPSAPSERIIGVLSLAVKLGEFSELKTDVRPESGLTAMLVDLRPDEYGKHGPVLEHPELTRRTRLVKTEAEIPRIYLDARELGWMQDQSQRERRLRELQRARAAERPESNAQREAEIAQVTAEIAEHRSRTDHRDPLAVHPSDRWLASIEPVSSEDEHGSQRDSSWVVVIEQPYEEVLRPVRALGTEMLRNGLIALGMILAVLAALWGVVMAFLRK